MSDATPRRPRLSFTPLEIRLFVVSALAGGYLFAFRAIAHPPTTIDTIDTIDTVGMVDRAPAPAVWFDDLPLAQRPAVALPPGWRLAARSEPPTPAPRVAQSPASRPVRVRTRSS